MSKYKTVLTGIPLRRKKRDKHTKAYPELPPAHKILGLGSAHRYKADIGFVRRAYPRIAYAINPTENPRQPGFSVTCSEWVQPTGETMSRPDLSAAGFTSREACYDYIDQLQRRLAENPAYIND